MKRSFTTTTGPWIRKRLTMAIIGPLIVAPLSGLLMEKVGMEPEMAKEITMVVVGIIGVYIFGQSWTDAKAIDKGSKEG